MRFKFVAVMVFTVEQKIKIIEFWYETKSYIMVRRICRKFNVDMRDAPKDNIILRFVNHFEGN